MLLFAFDVFTYPNDVTVCGNESVEMTKEFGERAVHAFRFFPSYNVGEGLINLSAMYYSIEVLDKDLSPWDWDVCGRNLFFMLLEAVGFFTAVLLTESLWLSQLLQSLQRRRALNLPPPPVPKTAPDEDVLREKAFVDELPAHTYGVNGTAAATAARSSRSGGLQMARAWRISGAFSYLCTSSRSSDGSVAPAEDEHDDGDDQCATPSRESPRERTVPPPATAATPSATAATPTAAFGEAVEAVDDYALVIRNLRKTYPPSILGGVPKHAVRDISLACPEGERFGLLGINGAGEFLLMRYT